MVPPSSKKVFVLDTNVLLHDPNSILHFQEHDVVLPIVVIEEIDHFKKDQTEIGRNARTISRMLDKLRASGSLSRGVPLGDGGSLKVDVESHPLDLGILREDKHKADNQILACAKQLLGTSKEKVVLVTKDTNLRIKADAIGILAEDYTTDRVEMDELYSGHKSWEVDPAQVDLLYDGGLPPDPELHLQPNQFVTLVDRSNPSHTALARFMAGEALLRPMRRVEAYPWGIKPRNREQQFAMELLLDPTVQVVTLVGKAGTGKTLLAIAAGLQQVVDDEAYDKILVSRPVMPMGRDLGYLPGDVGEKLRPYMQPIYDNLEFIVAANTEARRRSTMTAGQLEEAGYLSVEPLTYIRGRSIPKQYLVVDEAQNLTPHEVKTILTRAGEGTKVIFTGDPYQIDNPYVDSSTNGLSFLADHFKHLDVSGHVTLMKGERSKLAELASNLL
ncbi:MAG TPA: PhoH family protein [Geothrix sp.]|uniref:PhoH family protein n=1 Tax=Geothrix mesophila TaxID=2922723 RepID=UPI001FABFB08|nr:PhoH family protein [Geothrix sp. SG198]HJV37341.1 PhoH family protein [Geothrix sp.]